MQVHHRTMVRELSRNRELFRQLLSGLPPEMVTWKPEPAKWSLLEVLCHLYDEEREDFRARMKHVLETPEAPLPPIDPASWVTERKYAAQNFDSTLVNFLQERQQSITWLNSLENPKWDNAYQHPQFGPMSADLFFTNWLAHDYLHIRQIVGIKHGYLGELVNVELAYAGDW